MKIGKHMKENKKKSCFCVLGAAVSALLTMAVPANSDEKQTALIHKVDNGVHLKVLQQPFKARTGAGEKPFTRIEAEQIGVYRPLEFSFKDLWPPFWNGRGISSGDFDRDGDDDIVLASTDRGLHIFSNDGSGRFSEIDLKLKKIKPLAVFMAAPVDMDNDGWLDLFLATYRQGNHILWNDRGRFDEKNLTSVKNRDDAILSKALSFGDVDRDGDLDVAVGNWASGWYRRTPGHEGTNRIILNAPGRLDGSSFTELNAMPGETLSMLLSDIDGDGNLDLLEGNDFDQPDYFYLGDGKGGMRTIKRSDGIIPLTTTTTMSMKTADINNDLVPEIYVSQIAGRAEGISKKLKFLPIDFYCLDIQNAEDRKNCQVSIATKQWYALGGRQVDIRNALKCNSGDKKFLDECRAMMIKDVAIQQKNVRLCHRISPAQPRARQLCDVHFYPSITPSEKDVAESIPQIKGWNTLLVNKGDNTFEDQAKMRGLDIGGWSWDVKFVDVDLDGDQDVYITNGHWIIGRQVPSNLFYENRGKGHFIEKSGDFGLEEFLILPSLTSIDMDGDGDLDFIGQAVNGPVMAFINNAQGGNAFGVELEDSLGNSAGIGAKIVIHYGKDGSLHQLREIQSGGGFLSFDPAKAYFGLGDEQAVSRIDVTWPTGDKTTIDGPFPAGSMYKIVRQKG